MERQLYETLVVPTLEQITKQIQVEKIPGITQLDTEVLVIILWEKLNELNRMPKSGKFAKAFNPSKIELIIFEWTSKEVLEQHILYPAVYSEVVIEKITIGCVEFTFVLVPNMKELHLHYVKE